MKCQRITNQARDCKAPSRAKTPPFPGNVNQKPVQKKRKFNKGHLNIMELSAEEDLESE